MRDFLETLRPETTTGLPDDSSPDFAFRKRRSGRITGKSGRALSVMSANPHRDGPEQPAVRALSGGPTARQAGIPDRSERVFLLND